MRRSAIWIILLLLIFGFTVWFVVIAGYRLTSYYAYSKQIQVHVKKWEVKEVSPNKYAIIALYTYAFAEKEYQGKGEIAETYPNPWAAQKAAERWSQEKWLVWVNPKAPEKSVLDRRFPYKATVSAAVLLGLVIYFICLGIYVGVKYEQRR